MHACTEFSGDYALFGEKSGILFTVDMVLFALLMYFDQLAISENWEWLQYGFSRADEMS